MHETVVYVPAFFLVVCSYVMCYFSPLTEVESKFLFIWACLAIWLEITKTSDKKDHYLDKKLNLHVIYFS